MEASKRKLKFSASEVVGGDFVVGAAWGLGLGRGLVLRNIRASSWWAPAQGPDGVNTLPGTMVASLASFASSQAEERREALASLVKGLATPRTRSNI